MNLIEAVRSGKPYRRKGWPSNQEFQKPIGSYCLGIAVEDLLADDWEIEQKPITITKEQFDKACQRVLGRFASDHILVVCWLGLTKSERTITEVLANLAKELGLC